MIGRLGLIMLVVADLQRSMAFYRDLFGLKVKYRTTTWAELDAGTVSLSLYVADQDIAVNPIAGCSFAFFVNSAATVVARLRASGADVISEPHGEAFGVLAVVGDPDGYRIQLLELSPAKNNRGRGVAS